MIISILYVILAILGLSFLIFIHELGHYYMARRLGMRVETFSIGFGSPIYSWEHDGVRWQIGWLLFGGYVKIAGMDTNDQQRDPYEVTDGFFGKKPLDRIKVAFMGPFVNIVFALFVFALLWLMGGREKNFSEFTNKIGWVDPKSELYAKGIRPGDEILSYRGKTFQESKDHIYAPTTAPTTEIEVRGNKVDIYNDQKIPFNYTIKTYPHPAAKGLLTAGVLHPASYAIYDRLPNNQENPLPEGSPMQDSGIQYGDRIVWVDGEPIYSIQQLHHVLNDSRVLMTIQRGEEVLLSRVPRIKVEELKLDHEIKEELIDWQFEARLNGIKIQKLYTLPYNLNNEGVIEGQVKFIDQDNEEEAFPQHTFSALEAPLKEGDKILAVDGIPVQHSFEILKNLQQRHVNIVVERDPSLHQIQSSQQSNMVFDQQFNVKDLEAITSKIGLSSAPRSEGNLYLLNPIVPKPRMEFKLSQESQQLLATELQAQKREIEKIEDPEKRAQALNLFENHDKQLLIGLPLQDHKVLYNPDPFTLFGKVFEDIWNTLTALVTGSLNPKWMSGPVGIVQAAYGYSRISLKESFFLLGLISLNLGVLNLLPLPVLDGGTIGFSLFEMLTGRRLKSKTLEKLVIPFALLLMGFFIFLTYHDVTRLFKGFF